MRKIITIFSIFFIFLLLFDSIAPLIKINAYEIKNIKNLKNYEDKFVFSIEGKNIEISIDSQYRFYPIEVEDKSFLIGIVNIDNDNDEISKEISRGVLLGKNKNEIINNIVNKYRNRIWKYNGKNAYNYSLNNEIVIIDLDSLEIHSKDVKGGIAVIFKVINYTKVKPIQEGFYFSSKCINDGTSNKGRIFIQEAMYDLPFSLPSNKLKKNEVYRISYEAEEGYEFVNWTVTGGEVRSVYTNLNKSVSYAFFIPKSDIGNITAFYKNINLPENFTYSINITGTSIVNFKSISINDNSTGKGKIWIFDKIPSEIQDIIRHGKCYSLSNELTINLTKGKKYYLYYQAEEGYELYNILAYGGIIEEYPITFLGITIFKYYVLEIIEDISNVIILYKKKGEEEIKSSISNIHLSSENINSYLNEKNKGKICIYRINLEYRIIPSLYNPSFIWEISIKDGKCYSLNNTIKLEKQYLRYSISPYIIKYEAEEGYEFDYFASFGARILSYKDLEKIFIGNVFLKNIPENSYFLLIDNDEVWINAYYHNKEPVYGKFKLKSIGNDGTQNKGIICINDKQYYLPENSKFEESLLDPSDKRLFNQAKEYSRKEVNLIIGNHYTISYLSEEGYEFDKFEINGGKIKNKISRLSYDIIIEEKEGEIIAYYKTIKTITTATSLSTSSISLKTSTTLPSIKTTQTSIKTQSLTTSIKTEIKTTLTSTITITTVTSTITKVDILPPYKSESTSYKSETQTTTVTKTTTTTTSTITSITKQGKNLLDTIGETITSIGNTIVSTGKSILEGTIDSISNGLVNAGKSIIEGINDISKRILHALGFYEENISFSKTNCITTKTENQTPYKAEVTYEGKTSSQTIKVTSTTTKTNI
ncbi:MAG: hypothetical protein QW149_03700, partial [Nitrososphaerota archaeon]